MRAPGERLDAIRVQPLTGPSIVGHHPCFLWTPVMGFTAVYLQMRGHFWTAHYGSSGDSDPSPSKLRTGLLRFKGPRSRDGGQSSMRQTSRNNDPSHCTIDHPVRSASGPKAGVPSDRRRCLMHGRCTPLSGPGAGRPSGDAIAGRCAISPNERSTP
jgi:hypothetical protein